MPNEPPSWRERLISPDACCASLGLRLPYATLLIGVNRKPSAEAANDERDARVAPRRPAVVRCPSFHIATHEAGDADEDQDARVDERLRAVQQPAADDAPSRPSPGRPGSSVSPVSVGVKPRIACVNSGKRNMPPYRPKPSATNRKIDAASSRFLQHAEVDDRMLVARRELPPDHRDERRPRRGSRGAGSARRRTSPSRCPPRARTAASRRPTIEQRDAEPVDRPTLRAPGGSCRNVVTRNVDDDADRHVDEEAPVPGVVVGDPAAERGPERRRDDDAEDEDRLHHPLLLAREDLPQRRLRGGEQRRAAGALHDAPEHELAERVRRAAEERRDDEEDDRER